MWTISPRAAQFLWIKGNIVIKTEIPEGGFTLIFHGHKETLFSTLISPQIQKIPKATLEKEDNGGVLGLILDILYRR